MQVSTNGHHHAICAKKKRKKRMLQIAGTIYGGENRDKEKARLRKGVNIVVATPGYARRLGLH